MEKSSPPPGPPYLNGKLTKKRKDWKEQRCVLQIDKGVQTQVEANEATMDYNFLTLQSLLL